MANYISREAVIKMINEANAWHPECAHVLGPLRREIMNRPPADVRPVVLCRDCERRGHEAGAAREGGGGVTNADRIRAMSNEELAMFIASGCDELECTGKSCRECWLSWLKKEEFGPKEMPWIPPTGKETDNG